MNGDHDKEGCPACRSIERDHAQKSEDLTAAREMIDTYNDDRYGGSPCSRAQDRLAKAIAAAIGAAREESK